MASGHRLFGLFPVDEQCSWCSIGTNRKSRAMCYDCREFYCVPCITVNLSDDEAVVAVKSTKWVCFVCTWDERQVCQLWWCRCRMCMCVFGWWAASMLSHRCGSGSWAVCGVA